MPISENDKIIEQRYLKNVNRHVIESIIRLEEELGIQTKAIYRHNKYMLQTNETIDSSEKNFLLFENELTEIIIDQKKRYYKKLLKIKGNPYFASIIFVDEFGKIFNIYIGITFLVDKNDNHLIYDWRAPICSLFYDYGIGDVSYMSPDGEVIGKMTQKRQFKIKDGRILYIFDNNLNINDEILQEVLSKNSDSKMKNIVNTIQQEQNKVIRNIDDNVLIVQGIAGSGKTSVALHRIAFLLYKISNLNNTDVLVFSPSDVFSEYIGYVLPELGEDNTYQTTYYNFLKTLLGKKAEIQTYDAFINSYYDKTMIDSIEFSNYKQSDQIITDIKNYVEYLEGQVCFTDHLTLSMHFIVSKKTLNDLLCNRYNFMPIFKRVSAIAMRLSQKYNGTEKGHKVIENKLIKLLNIGSNFKKLYIDFYFSKFSKYMPTLKEIQYLKKKKLGYSDAIVFAYFNDLLKGFETKKIKQIVIDEAQDYTKLQFLLIKNVFNRSSFTILGDINQNINPFYTYCSLKELKNVFDDVKYLELLKTYRSSPEIIDYSSKILKINNIHSVRKSSNINVINRVIRNDNFETLYNDVLNYKKKYTKYAIICKTSSECRTIYENIKNRISAKLIIDGKESFQNGLTILPVYLAKGLEFDAVIIYTNDDNKFNDAEKNLYYVACTRAQHELIIYNN